MKHGEGAARRAAAWAALAAFGGAAQAASSLEGYALSAAGLSQLGAVGGGFSCATFGPDARTAWFPSVIQVGLPTDGAGCGVAVDSRAASVAGGGVGVASTLAVSFGNSSDPRSFVGSSTGRAGYGDLGVAAQASYSGATDGFTVAGAQAFGRQTEAMTFAGSGNGFYRPTFTIDGSMFNVGRTDSELSFFWSVDGGPVFLAFRILDNRGAISYYLPDGYAGSLPGFTVSGDLAGGLTVAGSTSFTVTMPIAFGVAQDVSLGLWAGILPGSSVGLLTPSAADVAFLSSVRLTGIEVLDAQGHALPDFSITSGSGTLYGPGGVVMVPEPPALALLAAGAIALAWRRRALGAH